MSEHIHNPWKRIFRLETTVIAQSEEIAELEEQLRKAEDLKAETSYDPAPEQVFVVTDDLGDELFEKELADEEIEACPRCGRRC